MSTNAAQKEDERAPVEIDTAPRNPHVRATDGEGRELDEETGLPVVSDRELERFRQPRRRRRARFIPYRVRPDAWVQLFS